MSSESSSDQSLVSSSSVDESTGSTWFKRIKTILVATIAINKTFIMAVYFWFLFDHDNCRNFYGSVYDMANYPELDKFVLRSLVEYNLFTLFELVSVLLELFFPVAVFTSGECLLGVCLSLRMVLISGHWFAWAQLVSTLPVAVLMLLYSCAIVVRQRTK